MHYIAQSLVCIDDRGAYLQWDPVIEIDMDGYNVYMAIGTPDNWVRANGHLLTEPFFTTPILRPDLVYYFRVTSVDTTGNESPPTDPIEFRLSDYKEDPNLRIVTPPQKVRIAAAQYKEATPYEDFMTMFVWQDGLLTGRTDITIGSNSKVLKTIPGPHFNTLVALGGWQ